MIPDMVARRAWQDAQDAAERPEPLPAPTHTSRDPWPEGVAVPKGAADLAEWARTCGWEVALTYAAGPWIGSRGNALRRSVGVRCRRGDRYALAFYVSPLARTEWTMGSSLVAGGVAGLFSGCNVTEVREYLERHGEVPPEWFVAIQDRITRATQRNKERAKSRPRKARVEHA